MGRNGQLWNGKGGFAFKKSGGAGGRKNPPYGLITGTPQNVWNKYIPGAGVGGLNSSVRRAKMRLATSCNKNQTCGKFYVGLGMNWDVPTPIVPSQPMITSIESGDRSLTIYFTQLNNGGAEITNYMYSVSGLNGPFMRFIPPAVNNPLTIYGLINGTTYNVVIKALNIVGQSAPSNMVSGTPVTVPTRPILLTATPGNAQITLTFVCNDDGGSPITNYWYSTNAGQSFVSADTTTSPIIITGLTNGTPYTVEILAVNSVGLSEPSIPTTITPVTIPNPPTNLSAIPGNESAMISFTPGNDGGSMITNYLYSTDGGALFVSAETTTSPITITGLINGVTYNVQLKAVNNIGESIASSSVFVTPIAPFSVPEPPIDLSAIPGNESAVISFTPGADGGTPITDYLYSIDNGVSFVSAGTTTSPITINGLTNGVTYNIQLKAVNNVGTSNASSPVSVTPNIAETIIQYTSVGSTTWVAPADVTSVEYLVVGGGGGSGATHDGGAAGGGGGGMVLSGTLAVVPGTEYNVIVGDGGDGGIGYPPLDPSGNPQIRETDGISGNNSQFATIIALGGSGGYRSRDDGSGIGGSAVIDPDVASLGGYGGTYRNGGGGGGGDSGDGANGSVARIGGAGGAGTTNNITGTIMTYGVGGKGGNAVSLDNASPGAVNSGNGAKAPGTPFSSYRNGANGGSGIVIIKYTPQPQPPPDAITNSLTTSLSAYNAAANGDWVKITDVEYSNLQTNVVGTTKAGISDAYLTLANGSGLTATDQSALLANSNSLNTSAIPANNYLYAFAVKYGASYQATDLRVFTNTNASSYTGFTQLGSVLPPTTTGPTGYSTNYYVIKGNNTINGATSGLLSIYTGSTPSSARYIAFYQNFSVNNSMRYLLFTPATSGDPSSSSNLAGNLPGYGAFAFQGLVTPQKQWN